MMKRYLTVIPARGGSKGIPLKNIYPINGKPLLEFTIEAAIKAKVNGEIAVSSDSDQILEVASRYESIKLIKRPDDISNDVSSTEASLIHALEYMYKQYGYTYDSVITLQPTSPLRRPETIISFVQNYEAMSDTYDAQLTLTRSSSDFWIKKGEAYQRLFPEAPRRRQEREPLYIENSAIYVTKTEALIQQYSVLGSNVNGFVIDEIEGIDINEFNDIKLAEFYLNYKGK